MLREKMRECPVDALCTTVDQFADALWTNAQLHNQFTLRLLHSDCSWQGLTPWERLIFHATATSHNSNENCSLRSTLQRLP